MLNYIASMGLSLFDSQSTSFNDPSSSDEQIDPWTMITTFCIGVATLALYSAMTAKRVTAAETNQKLSQILARKDSWKQNPKIIYNPSGCRVLTGLMDCFKSNKHPRSTPCLQIEAVQGIRTVPVFDASNIKFE